MKACCVCNNRYVMADSWLDDFIFQSSYEGISDNQILVVRAGPGVICVLTSSIQESPYLLSLP